MSVKIGPTIGIDGEKEYRKQVNELITQQKTFSSEMKKVESEFDKNTSAMEKSRKKSEVLTKQISKQKEIVKELEKGLEAAKKKYPENSSEVQRWEQAVNNARTELNKMNKELDELPNGLQAAGDTMKNIGGSMKTVGDSLTKYVTVPLTALAGASVAAWNEVDEGLDIVTKKTGATGQALEDLQQSALNIASTIPTSFETAGEAVGEVNTRFGLTGTALEDLSGRFIKFADLNDTDVSDSIDKVQKLMAAYGVSTEEAGQILDVLNKTGQDTGISMDTLEDSMIRNASSLKGMGMNAYEAAGFLGSVETSGADTSVVMAGLGKAFTNAAKAGKSLPDALKDFQKTMNSSASDQEKLTAACELFGTKAGKAIYDACKTGSLSFETLSTDASNYMGSVETTFENVQDPADNFKTSLNRAKRAGSKLGGTLLNVAAPAIEELGDMAKTAGEWFNNLSQEQQGMISKGILFAIGIGPVISTLGTLAESAGTVVTALGSIPGAASAISSAALPVGIAIGAFALLKTGIDQAHQDAIDSVDGLRDMLENTASSTDALNTATEKMRATISETSNNISEINNKADTAQRLTDELYKLDAASDKTAEDQARMKAIVGELNALYPGLELAIDGATGALNKGKDEVSAYVEETRKLALAEAYATGIKNAYADLADAQMKLKNAQDAQAEALNAYVTAAHALYEAEQNAAKDQSGLPIYTAEMQELAEATDTARTALENQNKTVRENKKAVSEAEATVGEWQDAYDDLTSETKTATNTTKTQTDATEDLADATEDAADETKKLEKKENQLVNTLIKTATMVGKAKNALKEAGEAAKAAGEDYQKSKQQAKDSLQTQIGLFDAYEERAEVNIQTLIANAHSREQAYADYADNLQKLMQRAEQSGSETVKAYAAKVSEMGMASAEELAAIVNATDEQLQELADADYRAELHMDFASEETAYALNGFMTEEEKAFATFGSALSTNLSNAIGNSKIWNNFKTNSKNALDGQKTYWKNNSPEAKVSVSIPDSKTLFGKKTAIQKGIGTPNTNVSVSVPGNDTLQSLKRQVVKPFQGLTATIAINTKGASDAGRAAARSIKAAAGTVYIPVAASRTGSAARPYAIGGFVDEPTYSLVGEAGPEVVIPLSSPMRSRALDLYEETGEILGMSSKTPGMASVSLPDRQDQTISILSKQKGIDFDKLYTVVATAARYGIMSANIRLISKDREVARTLRDMGVQFA